MPDGVKNTFFDMWFEHILCPWELFIDSLNWNSETVLYLHNRISEYFSFMWPNKVWIHTYFNYST